jgi:hypothetical protein
MRWEAGFAQAPGLCLGHRGEHFVLSVGLVAELERSDDVILGCSAEAYEVNEFVGSV